MYVNPITQTTMNNNSATKANFGKGSLLGALTTPFFTEPPAPSQVLLLPLSNGDQVYVFDLPDVVAQASGKTPANVSGRTPQRMNLFA